MSRRERDETRTRFLASSVLRPQCSAISSLFANAAFWTRSNLRSRRLLITPDRATEADLSARCERDDDDESDVVFLPSLSGDAVKMLA